MIQRANGRTTVPQIFIGATHVGGCDDLHALEEAGKLDPLLAGEGQTRMSAGNFKAAMIQMRSGLTPAANIDDAARLIGEAKSAGADYVQTPEMTNILARKREQLFAAIVEEDADTVARHAARAGAQARHLCSYRLAGDQAQRRARRQPFVPDRSARRDRRALRQDPHVRRRSRKRRKLSRVEQLSAGRERGARQPALGPARADDLLRPALPRALPRAGGSRRHAAGDPVLLHQADRRSALARADARARHRERLLRVRRRAGRQARERARDLRPFTDRRPLGPHPGGRRRRSRAW